MAALRIGLRAVAPLVPALTVVTKHDDFDQSPFHEGVATTGKGKPSTIPLDQKPEVSQVDQKTPADQASSVSQAAAASASYGAFTVRAGAGALIQLATHGPNIVFTLSQTPGLTANSTLRSILEIGKARGLTWTTGYMPRGVGGVTTKLVFDPTYAALTDTIRGVRGGEKATLADKTAAALGTGVIENANRVFTQALMNRRAYGFELAWDTRSAATLGRAWAITAPLRAVYLATPKILYEAGFTKTEASMASVGVALTIGALSEVIVNSIVSGEKFKIEDFMKKIKVLNGLPLSGKVALFLREIAFMFLITIDSQEMGRDLERTVASAARKIEEMAKADPSLSSEEDRDAMEKAAESEEIKLAKERFNREFSMENPFV